jgi:hypothetical protein
MPRPHLSLHRPRNREDRRRCGRQTRLMLIGSGPPRSQSRTAKSRHQSQLGVDGRAPRIITGALAQNSSSRRASGGFLIRQE